jgi:hypothetical protein
MLGRGDHGGDRLVEVVGDSVAVGKRWLVEDGGGELLADQGTDPKREQGAGGGPGEEDGQATIEA